MTSAQIMAAGRQFIKDVTGGGSPPAADPGARGWDDGARQAVAAVFDSYGKGELSVDDAIGHIRRYIQGHARTKAGPAVARGYDDMSSSGGPQGSTSMYSPEFDDMGTADVQEAELSLSASGVLAESGRRATAAAKRWTSDGKPSEAAVAAAARRWKKD
jgi:hypothetical protein